MNVTEIMASVVHTVNPRDPVYRAARMMKDHDIGCLLVVEGDRLRGIVTDRDLVVRALHDPATLNHRTMADIMTARPVCCRADDTVNQAAVIMEQHQVRRLPVLDRDDRLCGIVTIGDICTHAPHEVSGTLIEEVSRPAHTLLAESA